MGWWRWTWVHPQEAGAIRCAWGTFALRTVVAGTAATTPTSAVAAAVADGLHICGACALICLYLTTVGPAMRPRRGD